MNNLQRGLLLAGLMSAPAALAQPWVTPIVDIEAQILDGGTLLNDGSVLAVGLSTADSRSGEMLAARVDTAGDLIWQRSYTLGPLGQRGLDAIAMDDDGAVLIGSAQLGNADGDNRPWLLRVDADGQPIWSSELGLTLELDVDSALIRGTRLSSGDIVIAGGTNSMTDIQEPWFARVDAHGSLLQFVSYPMLGGPGFGVATYIDDLEATADGGVIVSGNATSQPGTAFLWKLDHQLHPQWHQIYSGIDLYRGSSVVVDEGGYWLAGGSYGNTAAVLLRTTTDGVVSELFRYPSPRLYADGPGLIAGADGLWLLRNEFDAIGSLDVDTSLLQIAEDGSVVRSEAVQGGAIASVLTDLIGDGESAPIAVGYRRISTDRSESDGLVARSAASAAMIFASGFDSAQ